MQQAASNLETQEMRHLSVSLPERVRYESVTNMIKKISLAHKYLVIGVGSIAYVYSLPHLNLIHSLNCGYHQVHALAIHDDILMTASEETIFPDSQYTIKIWDLVGGKCLRSIQLSDQETVDYLFVMLFSTFEVAAAKQSDDCKEELPKRLFLLMFRMNEPNLTIWMLPDSKDEIATCEINEVCLFLQLSKNSELPYRSKMRIHFSCTTYAPAITTFHAFK